MNQSRTRLRALAALLFALLGLSLAGCGGGGGIEIPGTGGQPSPAQTGRVSVVLKDAPLSSLSNFNIDVSNAVLHGFDANNAPISATIYPANGTTGNLAVDLLSLQALNQVLGASSIPVGTYTNLEMQFSNPSATSTSGVAQNITTTNSILNGYILPQLQVTQGSSQTVQIDINLQSSVIDLGGNNVLFDPNVIVQVTNQVVPLTQFPMFVQSVSTPADSFTGDVAYFQSNQGVSGNGGSMTVNCSSSTTFSNGAGMITTGNATASLMVGDLVLVDGSMLNAVVTASALTLIPQSIGNPGAPNHAALIDGTITSTSVANSTITIKVRSYHGGQNSTAPAVNSSLTLDVAINAALHRFGVTQGLADFVPGNACFIVADLTNATPLALEVSEELAHLSGTVSAVNTGGGAANGDDRITLTPSSVNQIPAAQLAFLPSSMTADVDTGTVAVGDTLTLLGFFTGTGHFDNFAKGSGNGGGVGPLPGIPGGPIIGTPLYSVDGQLAMGSSATINASNQIVFDLTSPGRATSPAAMYTVTVGANAILEVLDAQGNVSVVSQADAVAAINANPALISATGTQPPSGSNFAANDSLFIVVAFNTMPGGPGGPNGPANYICGEVVNTATASGADTLVRLDMQFDVFATGSNEVDVLVPASATKQIISPSGVQGKMNATQAELIAALNANPEQVCCDGFYNATLTQFEAAQIIQVYVREFDYQGNVDTSTNAAAANGGVITFDMDAFSHMQGPISGPAFPTPGVPNLIDITVTVPAGTQLVSFNGWGQEVTLTVSQAVALLNGTNSGVVAFGTADQVGGAFTADLKLIVLDLGTGPGNGGGGSNPQPGIPDFAQGSVSGTAVVNGQGNVEFTLVDQFLGTLTVEIVAPAQVTILSHGTNMGGNGGPGGALGGGTVNAMPSQTEILAALNAGPVQVFLSGNLISSGNFVANIGVDIIQ